MKESIKRKIVRWFADFLWAIVLLAMLAFIWIFLNTTNPAFQYQGF